MTSSIKRSCGSCTACCKTHSVSEIQKPAGKWCTDCTIGKGCNIYPSRPSQCRDFRCEWLKGFGEESERPDRVKYVLDYATHRDGPQPGILQIWEVTEGALRRRSVNETTRFFLTKGIWVSHLYLAGRKRLFVPKNQAMPDNLREVMEEGGFELGTL